MMTDQRPGIRGNAPLARHHRAMILDTCGIAVAGTWLLAVLMPSPVGIEAGGLAVAGFTVGAVILALTGSGSLASSVAGWGLALSGWITYAHFAGHLWAWRVLGLLILPAIILTGWSAVAYARHVDAQQAGQADEARQVTSSALLRWGRMLDGLGISGVQATAETRTRAGRQVTLRLPGTGRVTIKALVQAADGLAAAAKLPEGAVSFEPGRHAGEVIMHLDEHDVMAEPVLFPDVIGELTINAPLPVGVLADLTVYEVLFREVSAMVVGVSGNGKSNLLNVLIAQLTRCVDVIVIVIDLKGGRLAAPWIRPWIEERCDRPAVDWVATTRAEAAVVLKTMVDVVAARGASLVGGSKIIPSSGLPQFVIIADEMADIFGQQIRRPAEGPTNAEMAEDGSEITRKQRSEAVMPIWATQRGTVDLAGPTVIKSQSKLRFALGTASEADARSIVQDDAAAARLLSRLRHPGTGLVTLPGVKPAVVKFYRLDAGEPEDAARIDHLAAVAGMSRPEPDALALATMGDRYASRWDRSELYRNLRAEFLGVAGQEVTTAPPAGAPAGQVTAPAGQVGGQDVAQEFARIMGEEGLAGQPNPRDRMYALLAERPAWGLSVMEIHGTLSREGLGVDRGTIHRWLRQDIANGKVERTGAEGAGSRYKLLPPAEVT